MIMDSDVRVCPHGWVAGVMAVADDDLEMVVTMRAEFGGIVECQHCGATVKVEHDYKITSHTGRVVCQRCGHEPDADDDALCIGTD